jgi:hypothetical protein
MPAMTLLLNGQAVKVRRLDKMNEDGRVGTPESARDAGPGKAAADNDDPRRRLLREHRSWQ